MQKTPFHFAWKTNAYILVMLDLELSGFRAEPVNHVIDLIEWLIFISAVCFFEIYIFNLVDAFWTISFPRII